MEIIPQEKQADIGSLGEALGKCVDIVYDDSKYEGDIRIFLFGSWATGKKSFTGGDVDVFVGVSDYTYNESDELAKLRQQTVNVTTMDGDTYEDCRIELHWGNTRDFLNEIEGWERRDNRSDNLIYK